MLTETTENKIKMIKKLIREDFDLYLSSYNKEEVCHHFNVLFKAFETVRRENTSLKQHNEKYRKKIEGKNAYLSRLGLKGVISGKE